MEFGEKFRALRLRSGRTQEQLGEVFGVAQTQIGRWEKGPPRDVDDLLRIAKYFRVSVDYLVDPGRTDPDEGVPSGDLTEKERELICMLRRADPDYASTLLVHIRQKGVEGVVGDLIARRGDLIFAPPLLGGGNGGGDHPHDPEVWGGVS